MSRLKKGDKVKILPVYSPADDADTMEWAGDIGEVLRKVEPGIYEVAMSYETLYFTENVLEKVEL